MRFLILWKILQERLTGANLPLVFSLGVLTLMVILFILWRWGAGFLIALAPIFVALQITRSDTLNGIALMGRFILAIVLTLYALFGRRNRLFFSSTMLILGLIPIVMLLNSARAPFPIDAFGQSILWTFFYVGLILGGQRILADARGRAAFIKTLMLFSIVMACMQIPFFRMTRGRLEGVFENVVGIMAIGMAGVIILVWFGMRQKFWSFRFIFFMIFAALASIVLVLSAGRAALGGAVLGVLVVLVRKLKRNLVIYLVAGLILIPVGLRVVTAFPGFEAVKAKIFQKKPSRRLELFLLAWQEIKIKPLVGWGTGTSLVKGITEAGIQYHNSYAAFAVEHGIPFAVMMLFVFVRLPLRGLYLQRHCYTEELKDMANLSAALLSAYIFASFLGGGLLATTGILPTYAAIALQEGVYAENREIELYGWQEYDESGFLRGGSEEMLAGEFFG